MDDTRGLEIIIQLCRLQIQREREKLMTPKLAGALAELQKLQSFAEDEADKLVKRIHDEAIPKLTSGFQVAHGKVDGLVKGVDDIIGFADGLIGSNGGGPLTDSGAQSQTGAEPPRSSEVASK